MFTIYSLPEVVHAQRPVDQCLDISNDATYRVCCESAAAGQYFSQCAAYLSTLTCDIVTASNQSTCCNGVAGDVNSRACDMYASGQAGGGVGPGGTGSGGTGAGPSGTAGSGVGAPNTNPINQNNAGGTIAPTPQAGSQELKQCSQIRFESLLDVLIWIKCIISAAILPLLFTLAFLFFLWGVFVYIRDANDVKKREESKQFIYWGIIGLTVMVGVWGIVRIVTSTFGLGNTVPQLQTKCLTTDKNNPCR